MVSKRVERARRSRSEVGTHPLIVKFFTPKQDGNKLFQNNHFFNFVSRVKPGGRAGGGGSANYFKET